MSASALFLHREGVLVDPAGAVIAGAAAVVRRMNLAGVPVVVVGNAAPGTDVATARTRLATALGEATLAHDDYATEAEGHVRRLPRPGMLLEAAQALGVDVFASWFITADPAAIAAAGQAGCAGAVLVGEAPEPTGFLGCKLARARDLADAPRVMVPDDGGCWHDHR